MGQGEHPTSPPTVRRKIGSPQQAPAACMATMYPDGPAYLLKEPPAGDFPPSPFGLIEELLTDDPWKLLLGCIMLNQTTRSQVSSRRPDLGYIYMYIQTLRARDCCDWNKAALKNLLYVNPFNPLALSSRLGGRWTEYFGIFSRNFLPPRTLQQLASKSLPRS